MTARVALPLTWQALPWCTAATRAPGGSLAAVRRSARLRLSATGRSTGARLVLLGVAASPRCSRLPGARRLLVAGVRLRRCSPSAFLGPAAAFLDAVVAELVAWLVERYRRRRSSINLAGIALPTLDRRRAASRRSHRRGAVAFFAALALADGVDLALQLRHRRCAIARSSTAARAQRCGALVELLPRSRSTCAAPSRSPRATSSRPRRAGLRCCSSSSAFAYMARLVIQARDAGAEYANLSWGVLSGLCARSTSATPAPRATAPPSPASPATSPRARADRARPGARPHRRAAPRHRQFALSDRVMERGAQLTEADWRGIRRHPTSAPTCCATSASSGRWPRSSAATTSASTAAAIPRPHRRGDPRGRQDRRGRRGLRHADRAGHLPHADELVRGAERAAPRRRHAARRDATSRRSPSCWPASGTEYRHAGRARLRRELDMERRMRRRGEPRSRTRSDAAARLQRCRRTCQLLLREAALAARGAVAVEWPASTSGERSLSTRRVGGRLRGREAEGWGGWTESCSGSLRVLAAGSGRVACLCVGFDPQRCGSCSI